MGVTGEWPLSLWVFSSGEAESKPQNLEHELQWDQPAVLEADSNSMKVSCLLSLLPKVGWPLKLYSVEQPKRIWLHMRESDFQLEEFLLIHILKVSVEFQFEKWVLLPFKKNGKPGASGTVPHSSLGSKERLRSKKIHKEAAAGCGPKCGHRTFSNSVGGQEMWAWLWSSQ